MALKASNETAGAIEFWESVASKFGDNDHVFYELYNEPHLANTTADLEVYLNGNATYTGMTEMADAVRKHSNDSVLIIAGS
jgi:aryl-phospho-beta-D-glucosidase BglC (GH1 family)